MPPSLLGGVSLIIVVFSFTSADLVYAGSQNGPGQVMVWKEWNYGKVGHAPLCPTYMLSLIWWPTHVTALFGKTRAKLGIVP